MRDALGAPSRKREPLAHGEVTEVTEVMPSPESGPAPDVTAQLSAVSTEEPAAPARPSNAATGTLGGPVRREPDLEGDGAKQWPVAPIVPGPHSTRPRPPTSDPPPTARSSRPPSSAPPSSDDLEAAAATPRAVPPVSAPNSEAAPATTRSQPPESLDKPPVTLPKPAKLPSEPPRGALAEQTAELERLRKSVDAKADRIAKLLGQVDALREEIAQGQRRVAGKEEELTRLRSQHDSLRSLTAVRAERIRELENTHGEHQRRITELETELADQARAHKAAVVALEADHELRLAKVKAEQEQAQRSLPPPTDDLRAIYGIGPKFEKGLHAAGIHRYAQIAAWSDEDVESVAATLKVKAARIRKAGWVESARSLLAERGDAPETAPTIEGEESDIAW